MLASSARDVDSLHPPPLTSPLSKIYGSLHSVPSRRAPRGFETRRAPPVAAMSALTILVAEV
jgi:hypothetical protein